MGGLGFDTGVMFERSMDPLKNKRPEPWAVVTQVIEANSKIHEKQVAQAEEIGRLKEVVEKFRALERKQVDVHMNESIKPSQSQFTLEGHPWPPLTVPLLRTYDNGVYTEVTNEVRCEAWRPAGGF